MLPVEVTATEPVWLPAPIPNEPAPAVLMSNAPVLLVMVMPPVERKEMPLVPLAGAIAWVRSLTFRVRLVSVGVEMAIPAD